MPDAGSCRAVPFLCRTGIQLPSEAPMDKYLILALLDEGYSKKTWHGPNLRQSLKGVTVKQAAWRPGNAPSGGLDPRSCK